MRMTKKNIIIISWLITAAIIVVFMIQNSRPVDDNKYTISIKSLIDKSGEECIAELERTGIKLPQAYDDPKQQADAVKMIVYGLSEGRYIDGSIPYSYTKLVELAKVITDIALKHDPFYASVEVKNK